MERTVTEYPDEVYDFILSEFSDEELCTICSHMKGFEYVVMRMEVKDSLIAEFKVLRSSLNEEIVKLFNERFTGKKEDFNIISNHSYENISGRIKLKKLCKDCR